MWYQVEIDQHLKHIQSRPAMFIGSSTCRDLHIYLSGLKMGISLSDRDATHFLPSDEFSDFVQNAETITPSTQGWAAILDDTYGDKALDVFFKYWKRFNEMKPNPHNIPHDIPAYLSEHEYWERSIGEHIELTCEETQYKGEDAISHQIEIAGTIDGLKIEKRVVTGLKEQHPNVIEQIKFDTESAACVIWTMDSQTYIVLVGWVADNVEGLVAE